MSASDDVGDDVVDNDVSDKANKLEPIKIPAVFMGPFYALVILPNKKVYINYRDMTDRVGKKAVVLDIDVDEIADVVCDYTISILKTDKHTICTYFIDNDLTGGIKSRTKFMVDVVKIGRTIRSNWGEPYVLLGVDGRLYNSSNLEQIVCRADGKDIIVADVMRCGYALHGSDGYCYYSETGFDDMRPLMIEQTPVVLTRVVSMESMVAGVDEQGVVRIWQNGEYVKSLMGPDNKPLGLTDMCVSYGAARISSFAGIKEDGSVFLDTSNSYLRDRFPKDEHGANCKMFCIDINIMAVGMTFDGNVIVWGTRVFHMIDEDGVPLNAFAGQSIKAAHKM